MIICLSGCGKMSYKIEAVKYLKTKVANPASVDTIKFLKPDSICTSFYDTKDYYYLRFERDSLLDEKNTAEAAKVSALLAKKLKAFHKVVEAWDVQLIYKAKNKKGVLKTDTCRFTFDATLYTVKDVNGVDL